MKLDAAADRLRAWLGKVRDINAAAGSYRVWLGADVMDVEAVLDERDAARDEAARLRKALRAVIGDAPDCPFCDRGKLRKRVDGREPFHAGDCPWENARHALAPASAAPQERTE